MITIDELRNLAKGHDVKPTYLGLGIVRIKFSTHGYSSHSTSNLAYHFYSKDTDPIGFHPIHDHVFTFTSKVIKGTLRSHLYDFDVVDHETNYSFNTIQYHDKNDHTSVHPNIIPCKICTYDTPEGEEYSIDYRTLHIVERVTPKVITLINKGDEPLIKQGAFNYILDKRIPYVDTSLSPKSPNVCWEIIEDILAL